MENIPDDPIIESIERTGYPPWMQEEEPEEQPEEEPRRFVIDSDELAEWALKKVREAEDEHDRLVALVEKERAALDEKKAKFDAALERDTAFLKFALSDYMRTVKCKSTKTQESYQLLSGKLIRKKASTDYKVNDEALVGWLRENKHDDLVNVTVKPRWGDIKKLLIADPESGAVLIGETGEVVDGVTAVEKPETFTIKFN